MTDTFLDFIGGGGDQIVSKCVEVAFVGLSLDGVLIWTSSLLQRKKITSANACSVTDLLWIYDVIL